MINYESFKQTLIEEYKYKTELHAHTKPASECSEIPPAELVETYHKKGFDAVVITNHFNLSYQYIRELSKDEVLDIYLKDYEEARTAAADCGMKIILGTEIRFTENFNDYLIYGVDREILSKCYEYLDEGVEKFRTEVKLPQSVFIQAHPFRRGMELCNPEILDGIETFNMHQGHNSRVSITARYAKENGFKITTAGSDFHHKNMGHEAAAALRTKVLPNDSFELAEILKSGDYIFEFGESAIDLP